MSKKAFVSVRGKGCILSVLCVTSLFLFSPLYMFHPHFFLSRRWVVSGPRAPVLYGLKASVFLDVICIHISKRYIYIEHAWK